MAETSEVPLKSHGQSPIVSRYRGNSLAPEVYPTFGRRGRHYVALEWHRYENSLLAAVGFLELFNALDFPANVWNQYPLPTFVLVLMAFGGSVALIGTCSAFWDMHRCTKNISFLLKERKYLKNWSDRVRKSNRPDSSFVLDACMDVNFRELGWEVADRLMMDVFMGFGGIIVSTGTLLAIWGNTRIIFRVSNLLSGYVGNSFGAAYVLVNAPWSIFMWMRAYSHRRVVFKFNEQVEDHVRCRVRNHSKRHQIYTVVNGVAVFFAGIGSLISATRWEGYVLLIPCIVASVFANFFWRHKLGYNRDSVETWIDIHHFEILSRLKTVIASHDALTEKSGETAAFLRKLSQWTTNAEVVQFLQENGLYGDFCASLFENHTDAESILGRMADVVIVHPAKILSADHGLISSAALSCIRRVGRLRFRDEERYLLELLGCYLCRKDEKKAPRKEDNWDYCVSPVEARDLRATALSENAENAENAEK